MMEFTLGDLNQVGRPHTLTGVLADETGGVIADSATGMPKTFEIPVWIQKLSGPDHAAAVRRANAAKSRHLASRDDEQSEPFQAALDEVDEVAAGRDMLLAYVVADKMMPRRAVIEFSVAFERAADDEETEWEKDGYLQGLYDSWRGDPNDPEDLGLYERWTGDPDDPEAARVFAEITRFTEEVDRRFEHERDEMLEELKVLPDEEIRKMIVTQFIESTATTIWLDEFRKHRIFLSTRVSRQKRAERYFKTRAAVDDLHETTFAGLVVAYDKMAVDSTEGKDSAATTSSSPQSAQHEPPAASPSSGPAATQE